MVRIPTATWTDFGMFTSQASKQSGAQKTLSIDSVHSPLAQQWGTESHLTYKTFTSCVQLMFRVRMIR